MVDLGEVIERNILLILISILFLLGNININDFIVQYADTISISFIYLLLFAITDFIFQKLYLHIKKFVKKVIDNGADFLHIIPKIEYFFVFLIIVGIITVINYFLFPIVSNLIKTSQSPWLIALIMSIVLYLIIMNWFFPRFYQSLSSNQSESSW